MSTLLPEVDSRYAYCAFSASDGFLGKTIRLFEGGGAKVNHAFFYIYIEDGRRLSGWYNLGANPRGLYPQYVGDVLEVGDDIVEVWKPPTDLTRGFYANRKLIGAPYDIGGLIGMVPVEVAERVFHLHIKNILQGTKNVFCSEFMTTVIQSDGIPLPLERGERPSTIDPAELPKAFANCAGFQRIYVRPEKVEPKLPEPVLVEAEWVDVKDEPG